MLPFRWGLLGVALLIACTHGASINSAVNNENIEYIDDVQRSKRGFAHGQTQSQYLNFGQPELDGKAEAEATQSGSRSTVSGTHGMGQAQSQFSSGDCSGCGSPVYEYPTGSPDPLTLGAKVISYPDGKPSSMIGVPGALPGGSIGTGAGGVSQVGRPTIGGSLAPGIGGGYGPGAGAPGTGGAGQIGRPGIGGAYTPETGFAPGPSGTGQVEAPGTSYIPGYGPTPGSGGTGQQGAPGTTFGPGSGVQPTGIRQPGMGGIGQQGQRQPQLIAPPAALPGQVQGTLPLYSPKCSFQKPSKNHSPLVTFKVKILDNFFWFKDKMRTYITELLQNYY